jgi:hypothetical protein
VDRSSTGMSPSLPPPTGAELDGHAAGGSNAELQKNDADLQAMPLKQLRQRATTDGIDDDAIEVSPILPLLLPAVQL